MQIGSLPPGSATSVNGPQGTLPPLPQQSAVAQHKDKDNDHDGSTTSGADDKSGKQVNVVA